MLMTITEISYLNIRKISELVISFENAEGKPIKNNFIMMASGTGKTMTMELILGVFDGTADGWLADRVKSYKPLLGEINFGEFSISVKFDDRTYKYTLELNYETGTASIFTSVAAETGGGKERRRKLPLFVQELFTKNFVRRFVFDGEQAAKVLDNKSNEAEEAIKYLYGLDVFDLILADNAQILADCQARNESVKGSDTQLKMARNKKNEYEGIVRGLHKDLTTLSILQEEKNAEKDEIDAKRDELDRHYTKYYEEKNRIQNEIEVNKNEIENCINSVAANLRTPYLVSEEFSRRMRDLGQNMKKLKLPKNISKEFFRDVSEEDFCICGRVIGENEKTSILVNADLYLGEDQQLVLNRIRTNLLESDYATTLEDDYKRLEELLNAENNLTTQMRNIMKKLEEAGGFAAAQLNEQSESIAEKIREITGKLEIIESKSDIDSRLNDKNNLKKATAELNRFEERIAIITQTNNSLKKKQKFDQYIMQIVSDLYARLKDDIIKKTNEKIARIITDDFIEIERIDRHIYLKQKAGGSMGQTLSIAYCYIGTLFEDSELKFPFIIDSPVNSVDLEKRRVVAEIIPQLFNQMIYFIMSAEVAGFAEKFYTKDDTQFITIEARNNETPPTVNYGIDYFDSYHDEATEVE
jgi:hypothetical protein